jgi:predicted nucleotidyltransferase
LLRRYASCNDERKKGGRGKPIISDGRRWYNKSMATQRKVKVTCLDEIKEIIERHRPELKRQFHVEKIGVFGSYARGDQKKRSDVDFLVTFDKDISLFDHVDLTIYLKELMGRKVDVIEQDNLRPELRKYVLPDLIYL